MADTPRDPEGQGWVVFSGGFRPFFLLAAAWSALIIPLWLAALTGHLVLPTAMAPLLWHVHETVFGFGAAVVAGFLLTAVPNWTGRLPLQGTPLGVLVLLWAVGRLGVLCSAWIGALAGALLDLAFPAVFLAVVVREILVGRNWRNLPVVGALALLLAGNAMVHLGALGNPALALPGAHLGVATLLLLIGLMGGRIIPSFTRNWLVKQRPGRSASRTVLGWRCWRWPCWSGWRRRTVQWRPGVRLQAGSAWLSGYGAGKAAQRGESHCCGSCTLATRG